MGKLSSNATVDCDVTTSAPAVARGPGASTSFGRRLFDRLRNALPAWATPVHYGSLLAGLGLILFLDRKTWFIGDEFEFFGRLQPGAQLAIFVPHNGHWTTVPLVITAALYKAFGLRSVLPYNLADVLTHIGVAHVLWRWMRRVGSEPWVATGLAAVFIIVGGGVENLWSWFQISFVLPIGIGLLGLLFVDHVGRGGGRDVLYWPFGLLAIMCSGVGVVMVALAAGVALLRRGWLAALRVASFPALVYLVWLAAVGRHYGVRQPGPAWELAQIPQYMWSGITSAIDNTIGLAGAGGILFIVLGIWLWRNRAIRRTRAAMAFASFASVLLYFALLGFDRVAAGISEAALTRYGYVCVALALPPAALALSRIAHRAAGVVVVLSLCVVAIINGVGAFEAFVQTWNPITAGTKGVTIAVARLLHDGVPLTAGSSTSIEPTHSGNLTLGMVQSMLATGKLTISGDVTPQDMLNAELVVQVGVAGAPAAPTDSAVVQPEFGPLTTPSGTGCVAVAAPTGASTLGLIFSQPGAVRIVPQTGGTLTLQLAEAGAPNAVSSASVAVAIKGRSPTYVNDLAPDTAVRMTFPPGIVNICGLAPAHR